MQTRLLFRWGHRVYLTINALSVDVALGAFFCSSFVASILHASISRYLFALLAGVVWGIYTADHLLDARRIKSLGTSLRHKLHFRYFKVLSFILCADIVGCALLLAQLNHLAWLGGITLGILVMGYLHAQSRGYLHHKEWVISILYTLGIILLPLAYSSSLSFADLVVVAVLHQLVHANVVFCAWCDRKRDEHMHQSSLATNHSDKYLQRYILIHLAVGLVCVALLSLFESKGHWLTMVAMYAWVGLFVVFKKYLMKHELHRWIDAGLLLPIFILV